MKYIFHALLGMIALAAGIQVSYNKGYQQGLGNGKQQSLQVLIEEKIFIEGIARYMKKPEDKTKYFRIGDGFMHCN